MASFMTLQAFCEGCRATLDVYADELFEFDCMCRDCGGMLVLQEDGSDDEEKDEAAITFFDEATREDAREEGDEWTGGDRPTTADTEDDDDPYAMAAMALDPTGSDRYQRAKVQEQLEEEEPAEEPAKLQPLRPSSGLMGTNPEEPPLPSWDGGDTQHVKQLAADDPSPAGTSAPVDLKGNVPLGDLVEVVQVSDGTAGRGSRTYDAEEMASRGISIDPPTPKPLPPAEDRNGKANGHSSTQSLFGEDLDWLALIDDRLPDGEEDTGEEGAGRVFIRLPEEAAPGPEGDAAQVEQLQKTMESLESGGPSSLGSLIWSGDAGEPPRQAQRFDPDDMDSDTRRYDPNATADMDKSQLAGQPTMPHAVLPGEDDDDDDDARPTEPHAKKLETKRWAAAFAQERPPAPESDMDTEPTKSWAEKEQIDQPTQNWRGKQPEVSTRNWDASGAPGQPQAPSSRHLRRKSEGTRVVDKFRRQDLDPALVCARDVASPEADYFRQLYQQVFQSRNGSSPRVVQITSPRRGEGKTTIAANLAIAAARVPGKGVVLVDADPRGNGVLRAFGERSPMEGLLEALETGAEPSRFVVQFNLGHMDVVPLGIRGSNAAELIASDHMGDFIRGLRVHYPDWPIIIDSSSCMHSADPLNLAQHVDGVVLVVRAGSSPDDEVKRVTELLGKKRVLGVVLNDARGI